MLYNIDDILLKYSNGSFLIVIYMLLLKAIVVQEALQVT